jgi:peptide/nickel transport system permease protein
MSEVQQGLGRPVSLPRRRVTAGFIRVLRRKPLGLLSALVILGLVAAALAAPLIAPYDPLFQNPRKALRPPAWEHPFGTDQLGRDILSRVVWGARPALLVGLASVALATATGTLVGILSGYFGRWLDFVLQRLVDTLMAFPTIVLAIGVVAVLGTGTLNVAAALAVVLTPAVARVVRSATLVVTASQYIEAARCVGCTDTYIMRRHVLPNVLPPTIVVATVAIGNAIVAEASLSFLGLGTQPPYPSWGNMLSGPARSYLEQAPWLAIFPGLALSIVVLAFNLLGDTLRDVLDPRLRGE